MFNYVFTSTLISILNNSFENQSWQWFVLKETIMLANTGTVSFVIYGIFIAITIAAMLVSFYIIRKGILEIEKLDKLIELFKYTIVSVAIATTTLVISDLFKERQQDINELEYFDKYAQDIKKVDGIQERYQLSKYLAIVAPSGEMKKSWAEYYDTVQVEYKEYLKLKKEEKKLDDIPNPSKDQIAKREEVKEKISVQEAPLVAIKLPVTVAVIKDIKTAKIQEELGFEFLLNKDMSNAIAAFTKSENAYNSYHQAYEISKYLKSNKDKMSDPDSGWRMIYTEMLAKYSVYMSAEMKSEFKMKIKPISIPVSETVKVLNKQGLGKSSIILKPSVSSALLKKNSKQ